MFTKARSRVWSVGGALSLTLLVLVACGGDSAGGKSNVDLLKEGAANMKAVKTYHIDANIDQDGQAVTLTGDFDFTANNLKLDMSASGQQISIVKVGDKGWLSTDGGATYTESPSVDSMTESFNSFTGMWDTFKPEEADKIKDAIKDGTPATEKINGVDTKHMMAASEDFQKMGSGTGENTNTGTVDMWIGPDAKPYIHQFKIDGTQGGKPIKATVTWSKIGEAIEIKAP